MYKENGRSYLLSMIIPVYNAQDALRPLLECIQKEQNERLEVILVNDGSTDNSLAVLQECSKDIPNITLVNQTNHGAPHARNVGLRRARGKYLLFFDADDILGEHVLTRLLDELRQTDADLLIGNMKFVDEKGRGRVRVPVFREELTSDIHPAFFWDSFPGNKIYRRTVVQKNGIIWSNVRIHQDLNFYLKFLPFCRQIQYIKDILYAHVEHPTGSISSACSRKVVDAVRSVGCVCSFYRKKNILPRFEKELEYNLVKHILIQVEKLRRMRLTDRIYVWLYFRGALKKTEYKKNPYISGLDKKRIERFMRLGV